MNISCALWKTLYLGVSIDLGFQVRAPELEVPHGALGFLHQTRCCTVWRTEGIATPRKEAGDQGPGLLMPRWMVTGQQAGKGSRCTQNTGSSRGGEGSWRGLQVGQTEV